MGILDLKDVPPPFGQNDGKSDQGELVENKTTEPVAPSHDAMAAESTVSESSLFDTSALTQDGDAADATTPQSEPGPPITVDPDKTLELKPKIVDQLATVFDPEIPVNIYELGLIYDIGVAADGFAVIQMTLTAPGCPAAITLPAEVQGKVKSVDGVSDARVDLVWEPPWDKDRMSDAAKLELGIFD